MKILHLCLGNFYIDGYNYQENNLPRINKEDGHEVMILASTETFVNNTQIGYLEPSEYVTEYGVPIKRLPYVKIGNHTLTVKIRKYPRLYEEIAAFAPDVILSHNHQYWSLLDVIRYKKEHPEVKFYVDTHTAAYNSGSNWLSLNILHRVFYKWLIQKAVPYLDKYFYIGEGEQSFAVDNYGVPESLMEFYPLGGLLFSDEDYAEKRNRRRAEFDMKDDELLLVHSGRLEAAKRTEQLIKAFTAVPELKAKLVIIGSIPEEMGNILLPLMEADSRVVYLGWKPSQELLEYLCACDLYCQPGSVSATMQNAICCGCPVLVYPHFCYQRDLNYDNLIWVKTQAEMYDVFRTIVAGNVNLQILCAGSKKCARMLLDYRALAARLYR